MKIQSNIDCNNDENCALVAHESALKNRKGIFDILLDVNDSLKQKGYPGAIFSLVGSSKRKMIYVKNRNDEHCKYDHDIQCFYTSGMDKFTNQLRNDFINSLKIILQKKKHKVFDYKIENSTRVITFKMSKYDEKNSMYDAFFDIALIDREGSTIHVYDKKSNQYIWNQLENINDAYHDAQTLEIMDLRREYINLRCNQKTLSKEHKNYKSSSSLFIEAVNNVKNR